MERMNLGIINGTEILLVAAAECAAMVLPFALDPAPNAFKICDGPFFPIMQKTVEDMRGLSVVFVALAGLWAEFYARPAALVKKAVGTEVGSDGSGGAICAVPTVRTRVQVR
jgi:hypothetical protein